MTIELLALCALSAVVLFLTGVGLVTTIEWLANHRLSIKLRDTRYEYEDLA